MTLRELHERRSRLKADMQALHDTAKTAGRDMTDDEAKKFGELRADFERMEQQIERQSFLDEAERRTQGQPISGSADDRFDAECRSFSLVRAIASGIPDLADKVDTGREREVSQELARRSGIAPKGILVPVSVFRQRVEQRTISTTTPAGGPGSGLIATDHLGNQFIDRLRAALRVRMLGATVVSGLRGNVDIPRLKSSAVSGWVAENGALNASDLGFDKVSLTPKHAGCITEFSRNMLMQSSPDIESLVRNDFALVLAEAVDRVAIKGGGANEPTGILGTAGIGSVADASGNGGGLAWDKVIDLIGELDTSNVEGSAFLTNAKVRKAGRKSLKVANDAAGGFIWSDPNALAGYPAAVTNLCPSNLTKGTGNNLSALIFGYWPDLVLGYWSEFDLLVNPYEASAYAKGNVQVRGMLTMDVAVRHAESFAACQDLAA
jgi:HK97 family phage major capsid protein